MGNPFFYGIEKNNGVIIFNSNFSKEKFAPRAALSKKGWG